MGPLFETHIVGIFYGGPGRHAEHAWATDLHQLRQDCFRSNGKVAAEKKARDQRGRKERRGEKKKRKKKKKKKKKTKTKTKTSRPSISSEEFPARDALNRTKLDGCSCGRPEDTETFIAEHAGNTKGVPAIDANTTSYGTNVQSTESIPRSIAQGNGRST